MLLDSTEAFEEQFKRELNEETRILIKEGEMLLAEMREFKAQQDEAASVIKEARQTFQEVEMGVKAFAYLIISDPDFVKMIIKKAKEARDKKLLSWLELRE